MTALALSLDGCPYLFATQSVSALPTVAAGYTSDWSTAWIVAQGFLDDAASELSWAERMEPLDGDLRADGLTFVLHDQVISTGPSAGKNLLTHLATRAESLLITSELSASIDNDDLSISVTSGASFPSGSQTIWLEGEAILCDSRSSNTFTVNTNGRGYLGSKARSHAVDAAALLYPTVFASFPWLTQRRCILWHVSDANVATPLWRGVTKRAPRMHGDGARFQLQAEHLWTIASESTFVDSNATCRLRGYNARGIALSILSNGEGDNTWLMSTTRVYNDLASYCDAMNGNSATGNTRRLIGRFSEITAASASSHLAPQGNALAWSLTASNGGYRLGLRIHLGRDWAGRVEALSPQTADPKTVNLVRQMPRAVVVVDTNGSGRIPVTTIAGFPTTWNPTTTPDGAFVTRVAPVVTGMFDENIRLVIEPSASSNDDSDLADRGPSFTGSMRALDQNGNNVTRDDSPVTFSQSLGLLFVLDAARLYFGAHVRSTHWAYAFKNMLADTATLVSGSDDRDWDWSLVANVTDVVTGSAAAFEGYFDGTQRVGPLVTSRCALHGCGVALRGSKLAVVPFRRPISNETVSASLTRLDLPTGLRQTWETLPDGIANIAKVTNGQVTLNVRDATSVGRYGQARTVELQLTGIPSEYILAQGYRAFQYEVLSRVLYLWNVPLALAKIPVNLSKATSIYLGDMVSISEDLLPDGTGGRGLGNAAALSALGVNAQYGFVIGRTLDIGAGVVWLELLLQPAAVGYAPCVKVASSPTTTTIVCATNFIRGNADYTGGSAADGGASYFVPGDRVELIQRDSTTHTAESLTVNAVSSTTIEFTSAISAGTRTSIAGGAWWDLRYDDYGGGGDLQDAQEKYAFVGGITSGVISSSTDRAKQWAP